MATEEEKVDPLVAKFEDAKRFLSKEPPTGGASLHEHLTQVILKLIVERPPGTNAQFEAISLAIRRLPVEAAEKAAAAEQAAAEYATLIAKAAEEAEEAAAAAVAAGGGGGEGEDGEAAPVAAPKLPAKPLTADEAYAAKLVSWVGLHQPYLWPTAPLPEPEEGDEPEEEPEPEDPGVAGTCNNVLDDSALWAWAGVGFGSDQTYRLFRSLQLLAGREGDDCKVRASVDE
jgi:hypothetical protein